MWPRRSTGLFDDVLGSGGGLGRMTRAATPPQRAATAPSKNAGKLPPPNNSSQDPAPKDTTICGRTTERFKTPMDNPCPPPTFSVKVAVRE